MSASRSDTRYKLRDSNKTPVRYRDYDMTENDAAPKQVFRARLQRTPIQTSDSSQRSVRPSSSRTSHPPPEPQSVESDLLGFSEQYEEYELEYDDPTYVPETVYQLGEDKAILRYEQPNSEISRICKSNLRRLKNMLKWPAARTFTFCEFFYSAVDRQIFLEENEFCQLLQDTFPNLKTSKLRLAEWREVRRLIGKPRRFSTCFLDEERRALNYKRKKVRQIYQGACWQLPADHDLPRQLPRQIAVGQKVYARIRSPKDGIYAGTIDAIVADGYRVVFELDEVIPPLIIPDYEIMPEKTPELLSINYFLESNSAAKAGPFNQVMKPPVPRDVRVFHLPGSSAPAPYLQSRVQQIIDRRDDKVGNFPLRMLVIMVKLFKVLDYKKSLVANLQLMNDRAEKMQMLTNTYPRTFQERYAEILHDLDLANRLLDSYLHGIEEYNDLLVTNLSDPTPADKPDQLRKHTQAHANQLVKHCNQSLHVRNRESLNMIGRLTSIMLQIRQLGRNRKLNAHYELNVIADTLTQLKNTLSPNNVRYFQDCVEVHMKQIFLMASKNKVF